MELAPLMNQASYEHSLDALPVKQGIDGLSVRPEVKRFPYSELPDYLLPLLSRARA